VTAEAQDSQVQRVKLVRLEVVAVQDSEVNKALSDLLERMEILVGLDLLGKWVSRVRKDEKEHRVMLVQLELQALSEVQVMIPLLSLLSSRSLELEVYTTHATQRSET